jgi:hypothetical protein
MKILQKKFKNRSEENFFLKNDLVKLLYACVFILAPEIVYNYIVFIFQLTAEMELMTHPGHPAY